MRSAVSKFICRIYYYVLYDTLVYKMAAALIYSHKII